MLALRRLVAISGKVSNTFMTISKGDVAFLGDRNFYAKSSDKVFAPERAVPLVNNCLAATCSHNQ